MANRNINSLEESVQNQDMTFKSGETLMGSMFWLAGIVFTVGIYGKAGYYLGSGNPEFMNGIKNHPGLFVGDMAIGPGMSTFGGAIGSLGGMCGGAVSSAVVGAISFGIGCGIGYFSR
jgi:hypothetical protein